MNPDDRHEELLRSAFAELRREDQTSLESFERTLRRAPRARWLTSPALLLAAAAAVLIVLGTVSHGRQGRLTVPDEVIALGAWRPATDVLLETPGRMLLRGVPSLSESVLDTRSPGALR